MMSRDHNMAKGTSASSNTRWGIGLAVVGIAASLVVVPIVAVPAFIASGYYFTNRLAFLRR